MQKVYGDARLWIKKEIITVVNVLGDGKRKVLEFLLSDTANRRAPGGAARTLAVRVSGSGPAPLLAHD